MSHMKEYTCSFCDEKGHNRRGCPISRFVPFSSGIYWTNPQAYYNKFDLSYPVYDSAHQVEVSTIDSPSRMKISFEGAEPIIMTGAELKELLNSGEETTVPIGISLYGRDIMKQLFRFVPKDTKITFKVPKEHWPLQATLTYKGEIYIIKLAPRVPEEIRRPYYQR